MLEDEKALRTAHVAFGDNEGFPGGVIHSGRHVDCLVHMPTVLVGLDGRTLPLLQAGDLAV
jgi:leucyl aminopeptidase (aminopeptidase T)